jgi:hypothetical protein
VIASRRSSLAVRLLFLRSFVLTVISCQFSWWPTRLSICTKSTCSIPESGTVDLLAVVASPDGAFPPTPETFADCSF